MQRKSWKTPHLMQFAICNNAEGKSNPGTDERTVTHTGVISFYAPP